MPGGIGGVGLTGRWELLRILGLLGGVKQGLGVPELRWQLLLGIAALVLGLMVLLWGIAVLRRYLQRPTTAAKGSGWSLEKVKRLYESGQLTDKQYERLREEVIEGLDKKSGGKGSGR